MENEDEIRVNLKITSKKNNDQLLHDEIELNCKHA
jgi:hypothetical protein